MCKYDVLSYQCGHQALGATVRCGRTPDPENPCYPGNMFFLSQEQINTQQHIPGNCPAHEVTPPPDDQDYSYQGRILFVSTWMTRYNTLAQRFADMNAEYVHHWQTANQRIPLRQPCHDLLYNVELAPLTNSGHMLQPFDRLCNLVTGFITDTSDHAFGDTFHETFSSINALLAELEGTASLLEKQLAEAAADAARVAARLAAIPRATLDQPRAEPWVMNFEQDTRDISVMAGTDRESFDDAVARIEGQQGTFIAGWSVMVGGLAGRRLPPPPARRGGGVRGAAGAYGRRIVAGPSAGGVYGGLGGGAREAAAEKAVDKMTEE